MYNVLETLKDYSLFSNQSLAFYTYYHSTDAVMTCFGNDLLKELPQFPLYL